MARTNAFLARTNLPFPSRQVDRHLAHACRSVRVHCPFKHAGCDHEVCYNDVTSYCTIYTPSAWRTRDRHTHTHTHTYRPTARPKHRGRETERQTARQKHWGRETEAKSQTKTPRQVNRQVNRQANGEKHTEGRTQTQTGCQASETTEADKQTQAGRSRKKETCSLSSSIVLFQCPQPGIQQHLEEDVKKHLTLVSEIAIQQQKEIKQLREIVRHCKPFGHSKLLWKVDDFWTRFQEGKKTKGAEVHSPPFYTSPCGYKFKVVLFPYGNGSGEGSHLSMYIRLLPGDYDALLKWPFEGEITLTLLDQSKDTGQRRHITQSFSPDPNWKSFQRPTKSSTTLGFGYPQYVSHRGLESSDYAKENCLFIKATVDCKHSVDL